MQFTFTNGLVLRHGQRSLELVRVLTENELQFEDTQTRRPQMMKISDVLKRIWSGQFQVVMGGVTSAGFTQVALITDTAVPAKPGAAKPPNGK